MSEFANVGNLGFQIPPAALPEQPGIRTMQLSFNSDGTTVYKPVAGNGEGIDINVVSCDGGGGGGEKKKRKRVRARKYSPSQPEGGAVKFSSRVFEMARDDHVPLQNQQQQVGEQGGGAVESMRKKGGRPPGSVNKKQVHEQQQQQFDDLGSPGIGFTPHVITVNTGEDVSSKIMSFSQNGPRAICILSAIGTISSVTLSQAATAGGSVTYEGRFEILSLSGSFMLSEIDGGHSRTGGLSVSLAGPDGFVVGGGVAGLLTAASPVQVVVASFITDGQKEPKISSPTEPLYTPSRRHACAGPPRPNSPPSHGTLSESSDEPDSPINQTGPPDFANLPWK